MSKIKRAGIDVRACYEVYVRAYVAQLCGGSILVPIEEAEVLFAQALGKYHASSCGIGEIPPWGLNRFKKLIRQEF